jgi:AAA15 family ATPase/GTPase
MNIESDSFVSSGGVNVSFYKYQLEPEILAPKKPLAYFFHIYNKSGDISEDLIHIMASPVTMGCNVYSLHVPEDSSISVISEYTDWINHITDGNNIPVILFAYKKSIGNTISLADLIPECTNIVLLDYSDDISEVQKSYISNKKLLSNMENQDISVYYAACVKQKVTSIKSDFKVYEESDKYFYDTSTGLHKYPIFELDLLDIFAKEELLTAKEYTKLKDRVIKAHPEVFNENRR